MPVPSTATLPRRPRPCASTPRGRSRLADNTTRGTGRRKTAIARVRLTPGEGRVMINEKTPLAYLGRRILEMEVLEPLKLTDSLRRFDDGARRRPRGGWHQTWRPRLRAGQEQRPLLRAADRRHQVRGHRDTDQLAADALGGRQGCDRCAVRADGGR